MFPSTPGKEKSGAGEPTARIGWVVCPQAAKASSNEKINRHIGIEPPSPCSRKSSLYVDTVTNLLVPFLVPPMPCHYLFRLGAYADWSVAGRGVTSASTRPMAHLMASTYIFWILG